MKIRILFLFFFVVLHYLVLLGSSYPETRLNEMTSGKELQIKTVQDAEAFLSKAGKIEESNPAASEIISRAVRLFALKTNNPLLRIRAQLRIATLLFNSTKYAESLKVAYQVKELAESLDADYELGCYYEILGKIQISTADYEESLKNLYLALNYFDKLESTEGRGSVLNSIGVVFFRQGDLGKAMSYYTQAEAISILTRDTNLMGRILNNIGGVLLKRHDIPDAMVKFNESLILLLKCGMNLKAGILQMNLGSLYRQAGEKDKSIESYLKAMALFEEFDNYYHQGLCCINLSIYYETAGDHENWLNYLRKASLIGDKYGFKGVQLEATAGLQDYFEKHRDFDSAYHYAVMNAQIKQRIDNEKSDSRLSVAEIQYQFDKKNSEETIKQQRRNIAMLVILTTLIILILIAVLMITRQRQKAQVEALEKKGLSDELEFKNREIALQVMNLMKRNEFIIETSRRLMDISPEQQPNEMKTEVIRIAKSLQDQTDKEIWDEFELRFKQVHTGFYERLLVKFPDLTPNELKMCGLLRLNLTTKEMSELTGQRREAIEMARFRLRKHLGLNDPQINLVTFLGKI
jgi:tetratricopeptide (TPR) repeat protein